jgi:hypothetical protein
MKIRELYKDLCRLYDISPKVDIDDFIVAADPHAEGIIIGNAFPEREALFVVERADATELGLYISPNIIKAIADASPLERPDEFCCAVEGASHFLYLCDRIDKGHPVTTLELELQGEVDKFLLLNIAAENMTGHCPQDFFNMQFEAHRFDPSLSSDEKEKYLVASRLAAKYCHHMLSTYFNPLRMAGLIPDARDFFARDLKDKVARLTP